MNPKVLVVALLFCSICSLGSCCLEKTFNYNTVSLMGAKEITTITGCFEPSEALNDVTSIQIVNQVIPVIRKDAVHGLPKLLDIVFMNDQITDIEPGAFHNLTNLYLIKLKSNNIKTIREGVFNHLALKELSLMNNQIETIQRNALDDMPNLEIVNFSQNKIAFWNKLWFKRCPKISVLNFEHNEIATIPFYGFQNIKGEVMRDNDKVKVNILLNDNKIRKIEDDAFRGLETLGWLFLQRNDIEDIGDASLDSLKSVDWLRLDNNKLTCIPDKLVKMCPKVIYHLYSNPISPNCRNKYIVSPHSDKED